MAMDFNRRHIVVTGGTGALGSAVVGALLDAGAHCSIPVFNDAEVERFPHKDRVSFVPRCDLSQEADVARLYEGAGDLWASIHIAGGFAMAPAQDIDKAALMHMIEMNLVSCHLCCRAALRAFGERPGRIVNVAARPALEPRSGGGMVAYVASKAAVAALTQALAAEVATRRILVNAVAPSIIDTPANRASMPQADHDSWPKPAEIAATIAFLASPQNQVTSGAIVPVYGRA
jgi:NAD(P)-dependent dehydrogenase (short-subunit alcohol dehydrogenase family)